MKTNRNIQYIVVHCTATPANTPIANILAGWKQLGWRNPGYHFLVDARGRIERLLSIDAIANGAKGYNRTSIHVAYTGGVVPQATTHKLVPADTRTEAQRRVLRALVALLHAEFPKARVVGHRDLSPDLNGNGVIEPAEYTKACPCFDVQREYRRMLTAA